MKKRGAAFIVLGLVLTVLIVGALSIGYVEASPGYSIVNVNHTVQVLYNGFAVVNDTVTISGQTNSLMIGFPFSFGPNVVTAAAYGANGSSASFPVALNVPLDGRLGFYGARVDFPDGAPQVFSVVFVLTDALLQNTQNVSAFRLVFPGFPAFTEPAGVCNCSVVIPNAQYVDGTEFSYSQVPLAAFTYNTSQVDFDLPSSDVQIFDVQQFTRTLTLNPSGHVSVSDSYVITNHAPYTMNWTDFVVLPNATNIVGSDQVGTPSVEPSTLGDNPNRNTINFTFDVNPARTIRFTVSYDVPDNVYVTRQGGSFVVNMSVFQDLIFYVDQATAAFVFPQGAQLQNYNTAAVTTGKLDIDRGANQESLNITEQNVIPSSGFVVNLSYTYNSLWLAYGPPLWVFTLALVACAVIVGWRRFTGPAQVGAAPSGGLRLRPEDIRAFVDAYQEKMKVETEVDALDERVQKGRIPRRRYKVQRRTFETRLNALDRTLADIGGKMHAAGGHFSDLMRQLEVAETEIDEAEGNIRSIEARHSRAEISIETYRKLLSDYERRKDRAKTSINGILLRLREEIQ